MITMTTTNKIAYGALILLIVIAAIHYIGLRNKLHGAELRTAKLDAQIAECTQRVNEAEVAIDRQNAAIEAAALRIDTVVVEKQINNVIRNYAETRDVIMRSIEKDGGCENKINNIDAALRRYHGVGLRVESGNKN